MDAFDADIMPRQWTQVAAITCALMGALCLRVMFAPSPQHWSMVVAPAAILALLTVILSMPRTELLPSELSWVAGLASLYVLGAVCFGNCAEWPSIDQIGLALFTIPTATLGVFLNSEHQVSVNRKTG